jgi:hypothetical protein
MPPDPIAWLVLEPGHKVVTADDEELGKVEQVLGDQVADIFDGLVASTGLLGKPKYVPAELVGSIDTEAVHLTISKAESDRLDEYTPPDGDVR